MGGLLNNTPLLFGFGLVAIIGVAIFAWHFWGESLQKKLRGTEKMPTLIWKRDPKVEVEKSEIESTRYLVDHKTRRAWLFDSQAINYNPDGESIGVLISHDSCIPQYPGNPEKLGAICKGLEENGPYLWRSRCLSDIEKMQHDQSSNSMYEWLSIAALCTVLGAMIIGGIVLIPSLKGVF